MAVYETRREAARITGGGVLTWDSATGVLTWSDNLVIEFPTIDANIIIPASYGTITGVAAGESIYFLLPYLNTDDVDPAGVWTPTSGDYSLPQVDLLSGVPNPENEQLFVVAVHGIDGQLYFRNHLVLSDDVPSGFGSGGFGAARYIVTGNGVAAQITDMGFDYLPDRRHIRVYVNGVMQTPGVSGGGTGYRDSDIAGVSDYKEVIGAGTLPWFRGILWENIPASGEEIIIEQNVGSQGAQGPPGPLGGLEDSYNANEVIDSNDAGTELVPIVINEVTPGGEIAGGPPKILSAFRVPLLQFERTESHPDSAYQGDKVALILLASGDIGASGLFIYNGKNYSTLDNELEGTGAAADGVYYLGQGYGSGAVDQDEKFVIAFARRSDIAGADQEAKALPQIKQAESFVPKMDAGELLGQFAVNEHGEIATGWGRDFLRWHTMTFTLPTFPVSGDSVEMLPIPLNTDVVEPTAEFLGGLCSAPRRDDTDREVFFHVNPSNVYAGDNPFEIKLEMTKVAGEWNIIITYGRDMESTTIKVTLFFSAEYSFGATAPDEGDFSTLTSYSP